MYQKVQQFKNGMMHIQEKLLSKHQFLGRRIEKRKHSITMYKEYKQTSPPDVEMCYLLKPYSFLFVLKLTGNVSACSLTHA
jgi:hypothetical protein